MIWLYVTVFLVVLVICECIAECVKAKYDTCCCKDCPYKNECEGCDRG